MELGLYHGHCYGASLCRIYVLRGSTTNIDGSSHGRIASTQPPNVSRKELYGAKDRNEQEAAVRLNWLQKSQKIRVTF